MCARRVSSSRSAVFSSRNVPLVESKVEMPWRSHEARAWRRNADRGADGANAGQRARGGGIPAFLESGARCRPGAREGRRNQPGAAGGKAREQPPLPLPVAWSNVREAGRKRVSVLPELHARWRACGTHGRTVSRGDLQLGIDAPAAPFARGGPRRGSRHVRAVLHDGSPSAPGGRESGAARQMGSTSGTGRGTAGLRIEIAEAAAGPAAGATGSDSKRVVLVW